MDRIGGLYDTKGRNELNRVLNQLTDEKAEKVELGTFKNTDGVVVELVKTRDQLMELWVQLQDPTLARTFREGMKWTDEMIAAVQDKISEVDLELARWFLETNYPAYGKELLPYYRAKFHLDSP